jgi:hypothetical protein
MSCGTGFPACACLVCSATATAHNPNTQTRFIEIASKKKMPAPRRDENVEPGNGRQKKTPEAVGFGRHVFCSIDNSGLGRFEQSLGSSPDYHMVTNVLPGTSSRLAGVSIAGV